MYSKQDAHVERGKLMVLAPRYRRGREGGEVGAHTIVKCLASINVCFSVNVWFHVDVWFREMLGFRQVLGSWPIGIQTSAVIRLGWWLPSQLTCRDDVATYYVMV